MFLYIAFVIFNQCQKDFGYVRSLVWSSINSTLSMLSLVIVILLICLRRILSQVGNDPLTAGILDLLIPEDLSGP